MSKPEFTPGPWSFRQNRNCSLDFFGEGGQRLVLGNTFLINQDANAHLIAAAPSLYRCLAEVRKWMDTDEFGPWEAAFCAEIDAVLAKARGETHPSGGDRHGE
ncbi:hypothetical protein DKP76_07360 [Falsochrobactrum shanghaiense]|uniref:Uncharacterized protein n=1 Tax=Falsochrobactrum shanghaiense TaxID=2201899 RepID=A0A316JUM9_9HYPH|nr:hypothetical protein [Falsochrobactrum shanghaiense]PWL18870.1 hypothetical protein DKP76_07360 [Falsochrobactrum shanghaiense]